MNIDQIVSAYEEINSESFEDAFSKKSADREEELIKEFRKSFRISKDIILQSIDEVKFTKFMTMVQKTTVAVCALRGNENLAIADLSGELYGYTHTVVLTIIGALIQEEIL